MALILHKESITEDDEQFWMVTCKHSNDTDVFIPETYTFDVSEEDSDMQDVIVQDLTDKGYTDLDPVTWDTN